MRERGNQVICYKILDQLQPAVKMRTAKLLNTLKQYLLQFQNMHLAVRLQLYEHL